LPTWPMHITAIRDRPLKLRMLPSRPRAETAHQPQSENLRLSCKN
jgi:hypothetical protein